MLIPESDLNDPRLLWSRERGGYQLDAQWSDDFHHTLHTVLTGETTGYYSDFGKLEQLAKALRHAFVYNGTYSAHRRRVHGRPADGLKGHCFLGYLQNHDQIGNRAIGDRSARLMSLGRLKIGAALVLTSPFTPMLFQGEEWAASTPFCFFTDHQEPELAKAVREGRCHEFEAFGWKPEDTADPQAVETFNNSKLKWEEIPAAPHAEMLAWHQKLIQLRRREASLSDGDLASVHVRFDEEQQWLAVERGAISVICNLGANQTLMTGRGEQKLLLASEAGVEITEGKVNLPKDSVAASRRNCLKSRLRRVAQTFLSAGSGDFPVASSGCRTRCAFPQGTRDGKSRWLSGIFWNGRGASSRPKRQRPTQSTSRLPGPPRWNRAARRRARSWRAPAWARARHPLGANRDDDVVFGVERAGLAAVLGLHGLLHGEARGTAFLDDGQRAVAL